MILNKFSISGVPRAVEGSSMMINSDLKSKAFPISTSCFSAAGSTVTNTEREIYLIEVNRYGTRVIIDIVGNGFLYNMVRIIAGTLIEIGSGKLDSCTIKNMLVEKDRTLGGRTVGPEGLYLVDVAYE